MVNGETIQIRLTKQQKERVLLNMQNSGHKTISAYIRSLTLEYDLTSQKMIRVMYKKLGCDMNEHEAGLQR